ncbi:MAG: DUF5615 family PIN-like protein [Cyanobacteria bacterium P01_F01_bin.4]
MSRTIRFHLDENVSNAVAQGLTERGIDVTTTAKAKLIGSSDESQLSFIQSESRVLFTHDSDFLKLHSSGVDHPGIVYSVLGSRSIGEIVKGLVLIWEILEPTDMTHHVEFL